MKSATRVKVGGQRGNPGFRTASSFRYRQAVKIVKRKSKNIFFNKEF